MTTAETNESVYRRINEEIWEKRNFDAVDDLIAEDYVLHDPSMPDDAEWSGGREGYREMVEMGTDVFEDATIDIQQTISADDYVIGRWSMTGTHVGEMGNVQPSNEEVTMTGIEISRFEDGKLAESWQEINMLDMLTQAGELPEDLFAPEMSADD
ncbi:ester cyclase [Halomicrococcus sp. NG-SE-24]|uniref:ester cyclase n=1 Tax=Halomicrococcus sp. NG-SE-24 TaxID=3436928 RepID=UPI003D99EE06